MMPVGGKRILRHVMDIYARQGFTAFVPSASHRKEVILDYFEGRSFGWQVDIVDTGAQTDTGGRIHGCRHLLGDTFMAPCADGLSDVVLADLPAFHRHAGRLATITSVPLRSQYGMIAADADGVIRDFREKPALKEHWITAALFVMEKRIFDHWIGENLEREVFLNLLAGRHLATYRHDGFLKSMDTYKDQQEIEAMFADGRLPWLRPAKAA